MKGVNYCWTTVKILEYFTQTSGGVITFQPHIGLITLHEDNGDDKKLLLGELAALAQAIHNRIARKEYEHTPLFPVLMISLFGPQHGRILQANFEKSGNLQVHKTKCFEFNKKNDKDMNRFLCFIMSKPRVGLKLEFPDQDDNSKSGKRALGRSDTDEEKMALKRAKA
ncbi:hypothetical protein SI65_07710 [Aspergillus cristatus]|uniref:Uncharacterized protein n=1 Tax=Aspergillus cristatus TaxID=573508 RepID=A0A1E3B6Z5_ASPCR|nr:hypothetical protein SI65_07710 [Aspergillus cristatus]